MSWDVGIEHLGWTLVHSVWQIGAIAALTLVLLRLTRSSSANFRYLLAVLALTLSILWPAITFVQISSRVPNIDAGPAKPTPATASAPDHPGPAHDERSGQALTPVNFDSVTREGLVSSLAFFLYGQFPVTFPFLVMIWLAGVGLFSMRFAGGLYRLRQYRICGIESPGSEWQARFDSLCRRLDLRQNVRLVSSTIARTPVAVGFLKPLIVIPASIFLQVDPRQLEIIVAHELIHIRRFDPAVNILQSLAETIFFYHPCIWWISTQIRREREFATDAAVVESGLSDRVAYATALADLEEIRVSANMDVPSMATAANGGNLMIRIQRILQKNAEITRANSAWSAVAALALISAVLLSVFLFDSKRLVNGQTRFGEKKIAVGFVSIPPLDRSANPPQDAVATAKILIEVLKSHRMPAIGFVTGSQVSDGEKVFPIRAEIVKMWRSEGFDVGIGGFKHIWFYETPYDEYVANTEKNQSVVDKVFGGKTELHYFSYPFLNTGKSAADRDRFEVWLASRGLSSVKYTIDDQEWMYSYAYDMARNNNDLNTMKEVRTAFLDYMSKMFDHYEAYSRQMFGRDIAQTMVLTPSRLVADTGNELFGMIEKRGYRFVSMADAQSDPAYQTPEEFFGNSGISWFERWQMKQAKPLLDEPAVDPFVQKIWKAKGLAPQKAK